MNLQHPYCRTCGSKAQSKNVCHHCGCEPMKGNNYCCDCGTSTMAQAIICVECGASFQRKFPALLAILLSCALVAALAGAGYFLSADKILPAQTITDNIDIKPNAVLKKNENDNIAADNEINNTISNTIPAKLLRKKNDGISRLAKNILPENLLPSKPEPKPIAVAKVKEAPLIIDAPEKIASPAGSISMNAFSSRELRSYSVGCSYYEGRSKNNIIFITTNVYGYLKINGKVVALQGIQKGNDIARFSGAGYDVSIEIEGLAGNENEWVASGTMVIKDVRQRILSKHKIYSACTDF